MLLRASTQLVNSPINTGRIATLWPLFLQLNITVQTRNTFLLEDQNLIHSFKSWIIWTDVILYIRSIKSLRNCNSASWKHGRRLLNFLSNLKLSTLAAAEHYGWSWVLYLKLSTLFEVDHCGWNWALCRKRSSMVEALAILTCFRKCLIWILTGIRLSWIRGLEFCSEGAYKFCDINLDLSVTFPSYPFRVYLWPVTLSLNSVNSVNSETLTTSSNKQYTNEDYINKWLVLKFVIIPSNCSCVITIIIIIMFLKD